MFGLPAKIEYLRFEKGRRILAVSDIHGNLPYLKGLLEKIHFSSDDILIIDGDFLEKGSDSIGTVRYIMELCQRGNVYPVLGNCDGWHLIFQWGTNGDDHLHRYFSEKKYGLLYEMLLENGIIPENCSRISEYFPLLKERYSDIWQFMDSLPHAIVTDHYIFAHAGMNGAKAPEENNSDEFSARDAFLNENQSFEKWIIVGHWPVVLYGKNIVCANPIIDYKRHIISIDGGCVLKDDGQLNCLIIPENGSFDFSFDYYDSFPTATVLDAQKESDHSYYIRWGDSRVRVIERGKEFSHCVHIRTGYEIDILTKYLFEDAPETGCNDCTDYVLPLIPGDTVSIIESTSRGYFVKHNGTSGWYYGKLKF